MKSSSQQDSINSLVCGSLKRSLGMVEPTVTYQTTIDKAFGLDAATLICLFEKNCHSPLRWRAYFWRQESNEKLPERALVQYEKQKRIHQYHAAG